MLPSRTQIRFWFRDATAQPLPLSIYVLALVYFICTLTFLPTRPVWLDEHFSFIYASAHRSFGDAWSATISRDAHPPLYYVAQHFWLRLFGDSLLALRALNVPGLIILGLALVFSRSMAWMAPIWSFFWLIMLCSWFAWDFVLDGRSYFLLLAFSTVLTLLAADIAYRISSGLPVSLRWLTAFAVAAFLTSALHYFGFLLSGCMILVLFVLALTKRLRRLAVILFGLGGFLLAAMTAWINYSLPRLLFGSTADHWLTFQPLDSLRSFAMFALSANVVLIGLIGWLLARRDYDWRKDTTLIAIAASGLLVFVAATIISLVQPVLDGRYLVVVAPALYVVIATFLSKARHSSSQKLAVASLFFLALPYALYKTYHPPENWRIHAVMDKAAFVSDCRNSELEKGRDGPGSMFQLCGAYGQR